jgi:riboflavin synthase
MFTGLIQDVGTIRAIERGGQSVALRMATRLADALAVGDSLAVCGVCLTVTAAGQGSAVATAIPETLSRTTLGGLTVGARVNLESALRAGDRLGGHIVQGHVDGVGVVVDRTARGLSTEVSIEPPQELLRYIVEKGSIAVDGVSLTVAALAGRGFTVALVPHTLSATTLPDRAIGERVNLEADILAKYVERMLGPLARSAPDRGGMTEDWLREHGF